MNAPMHNALQDLKRAGAVGLPTASVVESAKDGMQWSGAKSGGDRWSLIKNGVGSYSCTF